MLERERSLSTRAVAEHGPTMKGEALEDDIEEEVKTWVHRTTIVPPPDDLDIDSLGRAFPNHGDLDAKFSLDEPDQVEGDVDDPTHIDRKVERGVVEAHGRRESRVDSRVPRSSAVERPATKDFRSVPPSRIEHAQNHPSDHARSDKWYLRVQLDTDCLADLWVSDRTPHNVLVWSEEMGSWVPLLTVRELRDAIRDAHDAKTREELKESNFVFVNTQGPRHSQPLPEPRLPASLAAPVPARPTSHWSQPKPRTISNVPPPMLTTAVPVVATPQSQPTEQRATKPELPSLRLPPLRLPLPQSVRPPPARPPSTRPLATQPHPVATQPHLVATQPHPVATQPRPVPPRLMPFAVATPASTVPPVVKTIEAVAELQSGVSVIPDFPRPARVPTLGTNTAAVRPQSAPPPPPRHRAAPATPLARVKARLAALPLVHVERALWLAAGVAVSSATMLLVRDPDANGAEKTPENDPSTQARHGSRQAEPALAASPPSGARAPTASKVEDVHHVEDLPIVSSRKRGSSASHDRVDDLPLVSSTASYGNGTSTSGSRRSTNPVAPANIKLASSPGSSGVSRQQHAGSAFDASTARRVLTSSATRASRCAADGPASGSVIVTFAPTGFVQSASISGLSGKGVNSGCVLRAFQEARVSPFSGEAVTVRKGFQIP